MLTFWSRNFLVQVILLLFVFCGTSYLTDEKGKFDELVEEKGVKILIDPKALMHVIGTKMDFVDDKLRYANLFFLISLHGYIYRLMSCVDASETKKSFFLAYCSHLCLPEAILLSPVL